METDSELDIWIDFFSAEVILAAFPRRFAMLYHCFGSLSRFSVVLSNNALRNAET
jgi:hypothetical protein